VPSRFQQLLEPGRDVEDDVLLLEAGADAARIRASVARVDDDRPRRLGCRGARKRDGDEECQ